MGISLKNKQKVKGMMRFRRVHRVRARVSGTAARPRLAVHRSIKHMRAQLIDDVSGKTLAAAADTELSAKGGSASGGKGTKMNKTDAARAVGTLIAEKAKKAGIVAVVFDRRSNRYHGRVAALADGARAGGLKF